MATETPLTCYICGETADWMTVDMIGLFKEQQAAKERFREKHEDEPQSYLFVCPDCKDENPYHAETCYEKYGQYQ